MDITPDFIRAAKPTPEHAARDLCKYVFHGAKAVFLSGPKRRGETTTSSYLELVVVFDKVPNACTKSFLYKGWLVTAHFNDLETLNYFFKIRDYHLGIPYLASRIHEGLEIPKPSVFSGRIKAIARQNIEAGPPTLEQQEVTRFRYLITSLTVDLKRSTDQDHIYSLGAKLYEVLADFYLRSQAQWSESSRCVADRLEEVNPVFYNTFREAFSKLFKTNATAEVLNLAAEVLAPQGGALFDGYRVDAPAEWRMPLTLNQVRNA